MPSSFVFFLGDFLQRIAGAFERHMRAHARDQLRFVERLRDIVDAADFQRPHDQTFVVRGGEKDNGDIGPQGLGADRGTGFEPVANGHEHVEEDEVDRVAFQFLQCRPGIADADDLESDPAQDLGHGLEVGLLVVDHEELRRARGRESHVLGADALRKPAANPGRENETGRRPGERSDIMR
jgi:hypothetical protein